MSQLELRSAPPIINNFKYLSADKLKYSRLWIKSLIDIVLLGLIFAIKFDSSIFLHNSFLTSVTRHFPLFAHQTNIMELRLKGLFDADKEDGKFVNVGKLRVKLFMADCPWKYLIEVRGAISG